MVIEVVLAVAEEGSEVVGVLEGGVSEVEDAGEENGCFLLLLC